MNITLHVEHIGGLGEAQAKRLANAILVLNGVVGIARPDTLSLRVEVDTSSAVESVKELQAAAAGTSVSLGDQGNTLPDPAAVFGGSPLADAASAVAAAPSPTAPAAATDTSTVSNAAPPAPATETAGAPAAAPAPAPTVDKNGLPWDERIHSSSRAQNKDGTWRLRKGVAEMTVKAVERELQAGMANAGAAPAAPPAPAAAPAAPPAPAAAPAAPPAPVEGAPAQVDFPSIVTRVVKLQGEGKLTQADLTAHANAIGLNAFADLARNPQLFQQFIDRLPA